MKNLKNFFSCYEDDSFLNLLHQLEKFVSKILALCLITVILVSIVDLVKVLMVELWQEPVGFFGKGLIEIFGLFLNVLIALELLENITGYLKKNVVQVELVVVTAIIAVARKIIIFDFNKYQGGELASLGFAIFALSFSYWLIKQTYSRSGSDWSPWEATCVQDSSFSRNLELGCRKI